jgi:polygalacturonase
VADKAIALRNCKNVVMKDFSILRGGHHSILPTGCENMLIDGVTVDTQRDGIDPDSCRNYVIRNTRVNASNDDAICLKSSTAMWPLKVNENALIQNCTVSAYETGTVLDGTKARRKGRANGRIKFGTESGGGFRNITIVDSRFESCMGLAILSVDGAVAENIHVENITMEDCREYPIYITTGTRHRVPMDTVIGSQIRNVTLKNIVIDDCEPMSGIQITGTTEHSIEGLTLENITFVANGGGTKKQALRVPPELGQGYPDADRIGVMPSYGLFARHLKDSTFKNIKLSFKETDHRPAIVFSNVQNVTLDTMKTATAEGVSPMVLWENVSGINVKNSPSLMDK